MKLKSISIKRFFHIFTIIVCLISGLVVAGDFKLGLENISDSFVQRLHGRRIGLVTNQTGTDQQGRRNIDLLLQKGLQITYLFAPEHGIAGAVPAGDDVSNMIDHKTDIPIVSLYAKGSGKAIDPNSLNAIDLLVFDMQDSGMRHYTYISTLMRVMQAAAEHSKPIVVLDRPNPLGGNMEGPLVELGLRSFISIASIPLRHGMTMGELAWYFNSHELQKPAQLHVVKMNNYNRFNGSADHFFTALSPNIKTIQSCYGYSFLGLLGEISPFDVGVGSDVAFQTILLPQNLGVSNITWSQVQQLLQERGIHAQPYQRFSKAKGTYYRGLKLQIPDITGVASFELLVATVRVFKKAGVPFSFSPSFDKAVGSAQVQKVLAGNSNKGLLKKQVNRNLGMFFEKARTSFMYDPLPFAVVME